MLEKKLEFKCKPKSMKKINTSRLLKMKSMIYSLMLLLLGLSTTCVAQQAPTATDKYNKSYSIENQSIIEWNEEQTEIVKETPVLEVLEEAKKLPDMERRLETKVITDLMREARGEQPD